MLGLLLVILLLAVLFGGLGIYANPLFFLLLVVLAIAALGGGVFGRSRWY